MYSNVRPVSFGTRWAGRASLLLAIVGLAMVFGTALCLASLPVSVTAVVLGFRAMEEPPNESVAAVWAVNIGIFGSILSLVVMQAL